MTPIFGKNRIRGKFFYKIFKFFLLTVSLIFIISVFAYFNIKQNLDSESMYYNNSAVDSISETVNREFVEIDKLFSVIAMNLRSMHKLVEKDTYESVFKKSNFDITNLAAYLNRVQSVKSSISGAAIHIITNDFIINGYSSYKLDDYYDKFFIYDSFDKEYLRNIHKSKKYLSILGPGHVKKIFQDSVTEEVISLIFCYRTAQSLMANIIVDIRMEYLEDILDSHKYSKGTALCIVDAEGRIIAGSDDGLFTRNGRFEMDVKEKNGSAIETDSGSMVSFSRDISFTDWKVYSFVPLTEFNEKSRYVLVTMIFINAVLLVLGIVLSFIFSSRLYSPIANLLSIMSGSIRQRQDKATLNEMDFITGNFKLLEKTNRDLADRMKKLGPYAQENIIKNVIMYGDHSLDEQEILELFRDEEVKLDLKYYIISIFRLVYSLSFTEAFSREDQERIKHGIDTVIRESIFNRFTNSLFIDLSTGLIAVLTNSNENDLREQYLNVVEKINAIFSEDKQYIKMLSCVGSQVESIQKLPSEYLSCKNALDNFDQSDPGFLVPQELSKKVHEISIENNLEEKFLNVVGSHNAQKVQEFLDNTFNSALDSSWSATGIRKLSAVLLGAYEKAAARYKTDLDPMLGKEVDNALEVWNFSGVKDILTQQMEGIMAQIRGETPEEEKRKLFTEYFEKNYMNENISLELMADSLGFHRNYLSKLLKDVMGQTFTDYISSLRMQKARELLEKTDMPIDSVAQQVGIISRATFNRLFKRHSSVSPATYRLIRK